MSMYVHMISYEQRLRDVKLSVTAQRLAVMRAISKHLMRSAVFRNRLSTISFILWQKRI